MNLKISGCLLIEFKVVKFTVVINIIMAGWLTFIHFGKKQVDYVV